MQSVGEWLGRADWAQRWPTFGDLVVDYGFVTMEFAPRGAPVTCSEQVWAVWRTLPRHRNLLEPVGPGRVCYAPLDWTWRAEPQHLADVGISLARAFTFLVAWVPARQFAWLTAPLVTLDLDGDVRLAFISTDRERVLTEAIPPEALEQWPHCTERGAVFTVGQVLRRLARSSGGPTPIDAIIERCTARDPNARYPHLAAVTEALRDAGGHARRGPLFVSPAPSRLQLEQGVGLLAAGDLTRAYARFAAARDLEPSYVRARQLCEEARARGARELTVDVPADEVEPAEAPSKDVPSDDVVQIDVALPRSNAWSAQLPARTFALVPIREPVSPVSVEAALGRRQYAEALRSCDAWLELAPEAPAALYARGKALLGLRRLVEARAAFDRVCKLDPHHLAAMLLRREADRALAGVRATTGVEAPIRLSVPEHLQALSEMLLDGRLDEAIALLEAPAYTADEVAQRLHAELVKARALITRARAFSRDALQ